MLRHFAVTNTFSPSEVIRRYH